MCYSYWINAKGVFSQTSSPIHVHAYGNKHLDIYIFHRTLLAQSEEFKKTVSEYKEQLLSLKSDKSLIESELESVRNELTRKNTLCAQYSKVIVCLYIYLDNLRCGYLTSRNIFMCSILMNKPYSCHG